MSKCTVLVVAGGRGSRFGGGVPKQYAALHGEPVLRRTIAAFMGVPGVHEVQVVIGPGDETHYEEAVAGLDLPPPIAGGATRQQSVLNGLEGLAARAPDTVAIHDAARPFVRAEDILACLRALEAPDVHGAVLGIALADTLKQVEAGAIVQTLPRAGLWRAQTPQVFRYAALLAAHRAMASLADREATALTDDAAVAERAGLRVVMVPGHEDNRKITTADDLAIDAGSETRTAFGFDVHAFAPGNGVVLGGVPIPHTLTLAGHSDADVALHALTDAVLGTIGAGDIGQHFPPSDPQWRGASSDRFLRHAVALLRAAGGRIVHLDLTLVCQAPRIGPHRDAMAESIAGIAGIPRGRVSVKATTTEGLGFTGRGEGIAAQAVATVELPRR
jgi:2-C-methyl-D-erythritol 4-phosphate cytidylyltransferase/2-C-methyl-D-erythritol 2,4-cyclodiphosphate synthase